MERKVKNKKCKECGGNFTPFKTTQVVCGAKCAAKLAETKVWKEKKKVMIENTRTRTEWLGILQVVFNKFIRERDKHKPCISCDKPLINKYDSGHYFSVGSYPNLRFNENNAHGQCVFCNQHKHGNHIEYGIRLKDRIGEYNYNKLFNARGDALKLTLDEIQELIKIYKLKIKQHGKSINN
jgi:hypothetical protein